MSERTVLWLTDRSRYDTGLEKCRRERFLSYHFGASGYGIAKLAQAIPLATGSYVHEGIADILLYCKEHDQLPGDDVVRAAAAKASQTYTKVVEQRGLRNLDEGERVETIIIEQSYLIEGLIWAFALSFLPWLLSECRIIEVEREELLVVGCTCGLGDMIGSQEDHEGRGCEGIGFQSRPDFLTEYRARPGVLAYWELKTVGQVNEPWETQWETKVQFAAGALGASKRLELPIAECYVVGLIKGRREGSTYNPDTKKREGALMQQSVLCYGFKKPGNPPMEDEDWQPSYNYTDENGKGHTLGRAYQKAPLWDLKDAAGDVSVPEFWAKWIPQEHLAKQITLIGPLPINPVLVNDLVEELVAEEQRWKAVVWELYEVARTVGFDWTRPEYQAALRRLVPRSWACRRYGKRHQCQFVPVCFYHEGWQDPLQIGFGLRRPHHTPEMDQMVARGLTPAEGWPEDEEGAEA